MNLIIRYAFILLLLAVVSTVLKAQDCASLIEQNVKRDGIHYLKSNPMTLIVRGNLRLIITFQNDERGLLAEVQLYDGGILSQNDEIIILNIDKERKNFRFRESGAMTDQQGIPVSVNYLNIGTEGMEWLSAQRANVLYIRKNLQYTMRKMSINSSRQSDFLALCNCFWKQLDLSGVSEPLPVVREQGIELKTSVKTENAAEAGAASTGDNFRRQQMELEEFERRLARIRNELEKQIQEEQKRAEQEKLQIWEEVKIARSRAEEEKARIADELSHARELARAEKEIVRTEELNAILEIRQNASSERERLLAELMEQRLSVQQQIEETKDASAREVARARDFAMAEIGRINSLLENARQEYRDELESARASSDFEIDEIRRQTAESIVRLREQAELKQKEELAGVEESAQLAAVRILELREEMARQLGKSREQAAIEKERVARELAITKRNAAERQAMMEEETTSRLLALQEESERERKRMTLELLDTRNRILEEVQALGDLLASARRDYSDELDSINVSYLHIRDSLAAQLSIARQTMGDSVRAIKKHTAYRLDSLDRSMALAIHARRNIWMTRLDSMQDFFENAATEYASDKKLLLQTHRTDMDSIRLLHAERKRKASEELARLQLESKLTIATIKSKLDSIQREGLRQKAELTADQEAGIAEAQRLAGERIAGIEEEKNLKLRELEAELEAQRTAMRTSFHEEKMRQAEELNKMRKLHQIELAETRIEQEKQLLALEKRFIESENRVREKLRARKEHEARRLADIERQFAEERTKAMVSLENTRQVLIEEVEIMQIQAARQKKRIEEDILKMQNLHASDMAALLADQKEQLRAIQMEHLADLQSERMRHADDMQLVRAGLTKTLELQNDRLDSLQRAGNERIAKLRMDYNAREDSLYKLKYALHQEFLEDVHQSRLEAGNEIAEIKKKASEEIYRARQSASEEISRIKEATQAQVNTLLLRISEKEEELKKLESELESKKERKPD